MVEDDPDTLKMYEMLLSYAGYRTVLWPQAKDAHGKIREAKPDLIILDMWLELPTSGELVLGLLEADPGTQHIPVIICSAHSSMLHDRLALFRQKGYRLLPKPFNTYDLLAQVAAVLGTADTPEAGAMGTP